ncbi:MAG TPA: type IV pilus secretin PilQ [Gammaproteobacteria bacterium]|nr:type IV pilus secretin PilQ [Gammaproteobacteria bacterium]
MTTIITHSRLSIVRRPIPRLLLAACALLTALGASHQAAARALTGIDFSGTGGNKIQLTLTLDEPIDNPNAFAIKDPARIAIDLPATDNNVKQRSLNVGVGAVEGITTLSADGRTRVVVKLTQLVPYELQTSGNTVRLLIDAPGSAPVADATSQRSTGVAEYAITDIDFRRTEQGVGRIIVNLSSPSTPVNIREEGGKIIADFVNTSVPAQLERRLDVTDFATPAKTIDLRRYGQNVRLVVTPTGGYDQIAYQAGSSFTIELKPVTPEQQEARRSAEGRYSGERLSLSFQDIEVRAVLQLIADFTGLNIVVSDTVTGNITLRLQDVPWDQALDIILKTKGLDLRKQGNVMLVAPAAEIAARERLELENQKQTEELAPLHSEFIQVSYAKASELASLLKNDKASLLSERGNVKIDPRTNTLIVQDTAHNLEQIRSLVQRLDIAVRQVLIESRIVIATDDFSRDLGVRFGAAGTKVYNNGRDFTTIGGSNSGYVDFGPGNVGFMPDGGDEAGLIVDLPVANPAGAISLAVGRIGSHLLQLELSAMESEGKGNIISSPRIITANQKAATIEQGVEIPYQEASSSGATSVSFKKAVLGLTVTPQITPDDRVLLDLQVNKDSRGPNVNLSGGGSIPTINTQSVTTQVLVDNGETVVLGGIYEQTATEGITRVPLFGDLPLIGYLFRSKTKIDNRSELLIFVTPKILKESLSVN